MITVGLENANRVKFTFALRIGMGSVVCLAQISNQGGEL